MAEKSFGSGDLSISKYAVDVFQPLDEILKKIVSLSENAGLPAIQVGPMDGLHLEVLTRAFGAKRAVEVGTLGGFSGTCIARGLPADGKLYTLEINDLNANVARKAFELAGVEFIDENGGGPGLRLRTRQTPKR